MRITQKQALKNWDLFVKNMQKATPVDLSESAAEKARRKEGLLASWPKFMQYYFPHYCRAPFAKWHKRLAKKIIDSPVIYLVRMIHRDGAKTTFMQMLVMYLILKGEVKNLIWVSKTEAAAMEMIRVLRLNFEANERILHDYGNLKSLGAWSDDKFVTSTGVSVRAMGKGQSPRGAKEEEKRPDMIVIDDIDDDEEVRNESRLDKSWDWMTGALYGTFSIDGKKRFVVLNNRIAKDCLVQRASTLADDTETVNLTDKQHRPTWPERFTAAQCRYMISKMGTRLAQREYFNNPITEGKVFKGEWLTYKKILPLSQYSFIVSYLDPSFKNKKTSDHKGLVCIGLYRGEYHILKAYCAKATVTEMVDWHYELNEWVAARGGVVRYYMEEVFLQDLLYEDFAKGAERHGFRIPVIGDRRKKPDKDTRIAAREGDFERGNTYFNAAEKDNHHMVELHGQFLLFEPGRNGIPKDGPDAYEGGVKVLEDLTVHQAPPVVGGRKRGEKMY